MAALGHVRVTEDLADFGLAERLDSAMFMRSLSKHITRPAMPDDEPLGYVATQAIVDFLAADTSAPIDGIIVPSAQSLPDALNVILFHKAARVESMSDSEQTEISVSMGHWTEDGWVEEYEVRETAPPVFDNVEQEPGWPDLDIIAAATPVDSRDVDRREESLRIVPESVRVHRVKRVEITTDEFAVRRRSREEQTSVASRPGR
ncbi:RES domain-containing protein [Bradyrhizobium sp. 1(2017)]|uniref:RES domain-containing protein n=1 Tax=Bradyrhizobium sp. 1(2017) TaxID=1404888 RepID=UPI00210F7429|nr:RES domain-containing protein [Bradyrhizobium sp. 1(2017)]